MVFFMEPRTLGDLLSIMTSAFVVVNNIQVIITLYFMYDPRIHYLILWKRSRLEDEDVCVEFLMGYSASVRTVDKSQESARRRGGHWGIPTGSSASSIVYMSAGGICWLHWKDLR
jgi:hypothetical protein